jgi:stage V sporulation protein D (sporulation-specific penicillin-binding protein)
MTKKSPSKSSTQSRISYNKVRLGVFIVFIAILFGGIIARAAQLQIFKYAEYKAKAEDQHIRESELIGKRGNIYFQDLKLGQNFPVAINLKKYDVIINAKQIDASSEENKTKVRDFIYQSFPDIDKNKLEEELKKTNKQWYLVAKDIPEETIKPIQDNNIKGFVLDEKLARFYPEKTLGAQVLGFVSRDSLKGQYGVEQYYNNDLAGENGFEKGERDGKGTWLANTAREKKDAVDGSHIVLTIDHTLQYKLEEVLGQLSTEYKPKVALGAIMNPKTGDIYAMASNPSFDNNEYGKVEDIKVFQNPLVSSLYEQGSIFKPITVGIGLDKGVINPNTIYEDKGRETINGYVVDNWSKKTYGRQTMQYALENSLNLGMVFIERVLGREAFVAGIKDKFQIANKTNIDLPGEVANNISNLTKSERDARDISYANASFGQGISMTPIRLLTSFNSIINNGNIVKPRIVKSIQKTNGDIQTFDPEIQGQSMSQEKAQELSRMLVDVVEKGSGKKAAVPGYSIGGKTGTGQIYSAGGYQDGGDTYQSFIEFATLDNPKYTLLISLDSPQGSKFSDVSVVPKMKELNEFLLNYFEIKPDKPI